MVTEKRISRMKRTFFLDNVRHMFVLSILQTVSGTSTVSKVMMFNTIGKLLFWIKHANFKLP